MGDTGHHWVGLYKRALWDMHRTLDTKHKKIFSADDLMPLINAIYMLLKAE